MIRSLKQRLTLFLLLPVAIMLFVTGYRVFVLAKKTMMGEWKESSLSCFPNFACPEQCRRVLS